MLVIPSRLTTNLVLYLIIITTTKAAFIDGTVKLIHSSSSPASSSSSVNQSSSTANQLVKVISLNDGYDQLIVRQSGSLIIYLTKSSNSSSVYLSYDNGSIYHQIHGLQVNSAVNNNSNNSNQNAVISSLFDHPSGSGHFILTDVVNKLIFITSNSGRDFMRVETQFKPSLLIYHQDHVNWIAGYDEDDGYQQIWLSHDLGLNWQAIEENVKQFAWGSVKWGDHDSQTLFLITSSRNGGTTLSSLTVKEANRQVEVGPSKTLLTNVDRFILQETYLFAIRKSASLGSSTHRFDRDLWISIKRENFRRVILPPLNRTIIDFHLIDITSDLIMIGVICDDSTAFLMISDTNGTEFKLVLDNINHQSNGKTSNRKLSSLSTSWLDVHKISGLNGIYIANYLSKRFNNLTSSVITYDNGATWTPISLPVDGTGTKIPCNSPSDCSFHLTQNPTSSSDQQFTILSKESAIGVIISSGVVGSSTSTWPDLYLSNDAGLNWRKILSRDYLVEILDQGSAIVAVENNKDSKGANKIYYSLDAGVTWFTITFLPINKTVSVHHLIPINNGKESQLILICKETKQAVKNWLIVKIDLSPLFVKPCFDSDYQTWIPHSPISHCLLGRKAVYRRKSQKANCSNTRDLSKPIQWVSCNCTSSDYQCDFGYIQNHTNGCYQTDLNEAPVEETCQIGQVFRKTKGYRKIFGNQCVHGLKSMEPDLLICRSSAAASTNNDRHSKKRTGLNGVGTLLAFLIMTILCFIVVGLIMIYQGCPCDRNTHNVRSNYHVSPSDSNRYAINVTFDNKALRSDYEYSDDEPLVQA